jgi:hypothetical protein
VFDRAPRNDRRHVGRHSQEARFHELSAVGAGTRTAELPSRPLTHAPPRRPAERRPIAADTGWSTPARQVVAQDGGGHRRTRLIAIALAITAVLLIAAAAIGLKGGSSRPLPTATATVTATVKVTATVTAAARPAAPATLTPSVGPVPAVILGDGTHLVPAEMPAGTYRTEGPAAVGSAGCHYERDKNLDGGPDSVTANGDVTGPMTLIVYTWDQAVRLTGGCTWRKVASAQ